MSRDNLCTAAAQITGEVRLEGIVTQQPDPGAVHGDPDVMQLFYRHRAEEREDVHGRVGLGRARHRDAPAAAGVKVDVLLPELPALIHERDDRGRLHLGNQFRVDLALMVVTHIGGVLNARHVRERDKKLSPRHARSAHPCVSVGDPPPRRRVGRIRDPQTRRLDATSDRTACGTSAAASRATVPRRSKLRERVVYLFGKHRISHIVIMLSPFVHRAEVVIPINTGPANRGACGRPARLLLRLVPHVPARSRWARRRAGFARAFALLGPGVAIAMLASVPSAGPQPPTLATSPSSALPGSAGHVHPLARTSHAPAFCRDGGARLWANPAACGWPGPANTGPQLSHCPRHRLTPLGIGLSRAIVIRKPNAVISCQKITGYLDIKASNVTVKNSTIISKSGKHGETANGTAGIYVEDGASAVIDHVKINGDNGVQACIWHQGTRLAVDAVDCYGADDGIFSWADTGYSQTTGDNSTITNSYFHGFTHATANGHEDGYQTEGASHGVIEHNTYKMTASADSAIAIWDSRRSASDITVTGNLITGGGFAVYAEDYSPGDGAPGDPSPIGGFSVIGVTLTGNAFSTFAGGCVGKFGAWFTRPAWDPYHGGPTDEWHRQSNSVLETGESIDTHNPHSRGTLCR